MDIGLIAMSYHVPWPPNSSLRLRSRTALNLDLNRAIRLGTTHLDRQTGLPCSHPQTTQSDGRSKKRDQVQNQ